MWDEKNLYSFVKREPKTHISNDFLSKMKAWVTVPYFGWVYVVWWPARITQHWPQMRRRFCVQLGTVTLTRSHLSFRRVFVRNSMMYVEMINQEWGRRERLQRNEDVKMIERSDALYHLYSWSAIWYEEECDERILLKCSFLSSQDKACYPIRLEERWWKWLEVRGEDTEKERGRRHALEGRRRREGDKWERERFRSLLEKIYMIAFE